MYCPNCGSEIPDDSVFCTNCGASLASPDSTVMLDGSRGQPYQPEPYAQGGYGSQGQAFDPYAQGSYGDPYAGQAQPYQPDPYGQSGYSSQGQAFDPYAQGSYGGGQGQPYQADPYAQGGYGAGQGQPYQADPYAQGGYGAGQGQPYQADPYAQGDPGGPAPYPYEDPYGPSSGGNGGGRKTGLILIILAAVLVLGVGGFFAARLLRGGDDKNSSSSGTSASSESSESYAEPTPTEKPADSSTETIVITEGADESNAAGIPTITPTPLPAPTAAPETPNYANADYILPNSDSSYISESQLYNLTEKQIWYARNEIYARHGLRFKNTELQQYFNSKDWYYPTLPEGSGSSISLNRYEQANVDTIVKYEKRMGYNGR